MEKIIRIENVVTFKAGGTKYFPDKNIKIKKFKVVQADGTITHIKIVFDMLEYFKINT